MRIRWTPAAAADLQSISEYLSQHRPRYRQRTMRKLYDTVRALKEWPYQGRPGTEEGTREILFLPLPYLCVYRGTSKSRLSRFCACTTAHNADPRAGGAYFAFTSPE